MQASGLRTVITGLGPVSAIGCGRDAFWDALLAGRSGIGPITRFDASVHASRVAAEVKDFRLQDFIPRDGRVLSRLHSRHTQLGLAASALAVEDAGLDLDGCDRSRVGLAVGSSVTNLHGVCEQAVAWSPTRSLDPAVAFRLFHHAAACVISAHFDLRGPVYTVSTGCNSGIDALGLAWRLVQSGTVDAMLVVGTDCEVESELVAALDASEALTTRYNETPSRASRPFDKDRDGYVIGEGAGALLIEAEPLARARGARPYARVASVQCSAAGRRRRYSHDRPDPDASACVQALGQVLREAGWAPETVDLVNANGSSSMLYDVLEARVLHEVFGDQLARLPVHSIKSMLGQHGAGSSAFQATSAALSLFHGEIPPTINHDAIDPACRPLRIVTERETGSFKRVLAHAIGFGGFYYSWCALAACE